MKVTKDFTDHFTGHFTDHFTNHYIVVCRILRDGACCRLLHKNSNRKKFLRL